ncbi:MAG: Glycosyl transferase group 1 [Parcubacteria group bacterium GW2011_GWC2_42_6]|nr:MAG: Glycosyl transferase group 1 [Parcubacteria group bacterium GW2011_GWA2_42_11]KKS68129.1 MAG: Glycosyl transferase group 1 [Parcubacteria group bacterium GW2011_GWC2_42_6]
MKILFITQKMDFNDDILGVYHNWVLKLAEKVDRVSVICLQMGQYHLPANVSVFSLGKEENLRFKSYQVIKFFEKLKYVFRFYGYIWWERKNYDAVFVHMNQEYVLLGGLFWRLRGKKIILWRNHLKGNFLTRMAVWLSNIVFCTSPFSYTAKFKKTKIMPVGTDMDFFKVDYGIKRQSDSILSIGRISPVKNIGVLLKAAALLKKEKIDFHLSIYGPVAPKDKEYFNDLKILASQNNLSEDIWQRGVPYIEIPRIYSANEIFVNLTPAGSFDKMIIEAMASGCLTLVCNGSLKGEIDDLFIFKEGNAADLAKKIKKIMSLPVVEKNNYQRKLRKYAMERHGLDKLINKILEELEKL